MGEELTGTRTNGKQRCPKAKKLMKTEPTENSRPKTTGRNWNKLKTGWTENRTNTSRTNRKRNCEKNRESTEKKNQQKTQKTENRTCRSRTDRSTTVRSRTVRSRTGRRRSRTIRRRTVRSRLTSSVRSAFPGRRRSSSRSGCRSGPPWRCHSRPRRPPPPFPPRVPEECPGGRCSAGTRTRNHVTKPGSTSCNNHVGTPISD